MWSIVEGPSATRLPAGQDGDGFLWLLGRDDGEERTIRVEISRTALASSGLPSPIDQAVGTMGASAVLGVVHWVEPPDVIAVSTGNITPWPGAADLGVA
jgi:hypothetical protein